VPFIYRHFSESSTAVVYNSKWHTDRH